MNQDNKKCSEIARKVGLSMRSSYSILTYKKRIHKKKCGPKPKIDLRLATQIKKYIQNENNNSLKVNFPKIIKNMNIPLERRTLNDWMLDKEFIYQLQTQNIQLTKNDKMKRVSLCKSWVDQNIQ